jgi:predicted secreted protein
MGVLSAPASSRPQESLRNKKVLAALIVVVVVGVAGALWITYAPSGNAQATTLADGTIKYAFSTANQNPSITGKVGEIFIVQLSSNAASTAYDWAVSTSSGVQYLNYTVVSTSALIGGPQVRNYFFHITGSGSQTVILQDKRPFAPFDVAATITLHLTAS